MQIGLGKYDWSKIDTVSNDIYDEVSTIIDSQKFFDPIHSKIYEVIEKLISKGLLANPITLKDYFENNEGLKELGGHEYLIKITKYYGI